MNALDVIIGLIGFALTLMVFSYLLGDNFSSGLPFICL